MTKIGNRDMNQMREREALQALAEATDWKPYACHTLALTLRMSVCMCARAHARVCDRVSGFRWRNNYSAWDSAGIPRSNGEKIDRYWQKNIDWDRQGGKKHFCHIAAETFL